MYSAAKTVLYNSILLIRGGHNRKARVISKFKDNKLDRYVEVGEIIEITQKRLDEIRNAEAYYKRKLVEIVEQEQITKEEKTIVKEEQPKGKKPTKK